MLYSKLRIITVIIQLLIMFYTFYSYKKKFKNGQVVGQPKLPPSMIHTKKLPVYSRFKTLPTSHDHEFKSLNSLRNWIADTPRYITINNLYIFFPKFSFRNLLLSYLFLFNVHANFLSISMKHLILSRWKYGLLFWYTNGIIFTNKTGCQTLTLITN